VFLDNLTDGASFVVLSWAVPNQVGLGHINCLPNSTVIGLMINRGFVFLEKETQEARDLIPFSDECPWFKDTLMIFSFDHLARKTS
jgi:hypothetical protein